MMLAMMPALMTSARPAMPCTRRGARLSSQQSWDSKVTMETWRI